MWRPGPAGHAVLCLAAARNAAGKGVNAAGKRPCGKEDTSAREQGSLSVQWHVTIFSETRAKG
jgi:hypothetical protein